MDKCFAVKKCKNMFNILQYPLKVGTALLKNVIIG